MGFDKEMFARRLFEARKKKGMTQSELGNLCNMAQSTISSYEKGNKSPNIEDAVLLAEKLDISIDWLCGHDERNEPITSLQWLIYLDKLINDPPVVGKMRIDDGNGYVDDEPERLFYFDYDDKKIIIDLSSNFMSPFIDAYNGLWAMQGGISKKIYDGFLMELLKMYSYIFIPGYDIEKAFMLRHEQLIEAPINNELPF